MKKVAILAVISVAFGVQAQAQTATGTVAMLADNNTATVKTAKAAAITDKAEAQKPVTIFAELVSEKNMSEELTAWVEQQIAQPKRKSKRIVR